MDRKVAVTWLPDRTEIFAWLNWDNRTRLRTPIGNRPPAEHEQHLA